MEQLLALLMQHSPLVSLALIAGFAAVARAYARQTIERIDSRLGRIEDVAREVGRVDADLRRLIQEMPLHYQRRDEAIRALGSTSPAFQAWEYANNIARHGATVQAMAAQFGLSEAQLDQMFRAAALVEA